MLDRQWMIDREHEWKKESQETQEKIVNIARDTAKSTRIAAWAALAIVVATVVGLFFGGITIKDNRSPIPPPAQTATPGSP